MKQFFKMMFASMLGFFLTGFILLVIVVGIVGTMVSASKSEIVEIKEKSILFLPLDHAIVDKGSSNPFSNLNIFNLSNSSNQGLFEIIKTIKTAKNDPNINGIYLELSDIPAGIASVEEIRDALIDFKTSKKFIITYAETFTQKSYYLASVSDKIFMNPQGYLEFKGLSADVMFYKGFLDKIGVEPMILRHGKFKSAVEPFLMDKMSDANREQTKTYLFSIWNHLLSGISEQRKIEVTKLNEYADNLSIRKSSDALSCKLIDSLMYKDQVLEYLEKKTNLKKGTEINFVRLEKYSKTPLMTKVSVSKDKIAIVFASGEIVSGNSKDNAIASEAIAEIIRKVRDDIKIKAIVIRVNSPGGSALASDVIWREVAKAKAVKPVVVSMGDVAASGGYYISCAADKIFASKTTITGSIGVFGMMANAQKLMNDKLGITVDNVKTNKHSDLGSFYRPFNPGEREIMQQSVEDVYDVFLTRVSDGRKMKKENVDSIAQGRVWAGNDAKNIGLVDEFGGMEKAIEYAVKLAKLKDYKLAIYPKEEEPIVRIMKLFNGDIESKILQTYFGKDITYYNGLKWLLSKDGIQARMLYNLDIN